MPMRFTPHVVFAHPVVGEARLSPDGALVAFEVTETTRPGGPGLPAFPRSAIWVVPAAGGEPAVRLTYGRSDTTPRWSPDGRTLAFLSDRETDGSRQVHLLPRDGGEARRIGTLSGEIPVGRVLTSLEWFPDGRRLALLMSEPQDEATRARVAAGDDRIVFEEEPRHQRAWAMEASTGTIEAISPPDLKVWEFALSPDGSRIAAVVSDQPYEWDWYLLPRLPACAPDAPVASPRGVRVPTGEHRRDRGRFSGVNRTSSRRRHRSGTGISPGSSAGRRRRALRWRSGHRETTPPRRRAG